MANHVTHYLSGSGWGDDYITGCHLGFHHQHTSDWSHVTCKYCLNKLTRIKEKSRKELIARILQKATSHHQLWRNPMISVTRSDYMCPAVGILYTNNRITKKDYEIVLAYIKELLGGYNAVSEMLNVSPDSPAIRSWWIEKIQQLQKESQ